MFKRILLIVLGGILLLFVVCVVIDIIRYKPDKVITCLGKKLWQIEVDSTFCFSSVVNEDFDSLYILYPYINKLEISENINISDWEKENMFITLGNDDRQAIFFTKNKNVVFRAFIRKDTTTFSYESLGIKKGFSPNTRFKMIRGKYGQKEMILAE